MYSIRMWDSGFWFGELFTWRMILLIMQWQTVISIKGPSEVIVPGAGHIQRLPHSLKPSLQETRAILFYHRYPRDGNIRKARNKHGISSSPDNVLRMKTWSSTLGDQEQRIVCCDSARDSSGNSVSPDSRHDTRQEEKSNVAASTSQEEPLSNPLQSKQRRHRSPAHNNATDVTNVTSTAAPVILDGSQSKGISDKEIVIIVVCSAIGLVIFFLLTALIAKFYWHKMRDDGSGYQGVLQKDMSDGNSPCTDDQMDIQITSKEKDARIHSNMFAQIDEIDEDNCSVSPATKSRRHSALQNGVGGSEGEMKPLIPSSNPPLSPNMEDSNGKLSELDGSEENSSDKKDDNDEDDDDDEDLGQGTDTGNGAVLQGTAEVHMEAIASQLDPEPEPRLYYRTGLSQSDYSLSSFTSVNPSYRYGNQVGYMAGYYGYPSGEVHSPEVIEFDADDQLLLPPPADFDLQPLNSLAFDVPPELMDVPHQGSQPAGESDSVLRDGESGSAEMEFPQDLEDEALSCSVGQSTALDNGSEDFSLGVNIDEGDVADCGACDEDDNSAATAEVTVGTNGVFGSAATECNGKTETLPDDCIGPSSSLPVKINTDSSNVLSRSNPSKSSSVPGDPRASATVSATMAVDDGSTGGVTIKSENNSNSIKIDGNSIAVT